MKQKKLVRKKAIKGKHFRNKIQSIADESDVDESTEKSLKRLMTSFKKISPNEVPEFTD